MRSSPEAGDAFGAHRLGGGRELPRTPCVAPARSLGVSEHLDRSGPPETARATHRLSDRFLRLPRADAAVDQEPRPEYELGLVGREIERCVRDVLREPEFARELPRADRPATLLRIVVRVT